MDSVRRWDNGAGGGLESAVRYLALLSIYGGL